jgi:eukaryotic-like serine/threonine-protein kinase
MSVEANEVASELWTRWQGQVINGVYPLGRYLGCSDHSGVFLTKHAARPADVAIKLVPTNRSLAESQLPRWKRAAALAHPHLLRLFECGGCQLDGLPYLFIVMEYADQTLAQLLLHRAMTDDEAREMLPPILDGITFLHGRNLVHGQLKPANVLVVGDQLKLASDTIRRVNEGPISLSAPTIYDSPESRKGSHSTAADIWALGASLFEALARRPPADGSEPGVAVVLPSDFSPAFRDVVTRCLSPNPHDRPSVTELLALAGGGSPGPEPAATSQSAALPPSETGTREPAPPRIAPAQVVRDAPRSTRSKAESHKRLTWLAMVLGAILVLSLGWTGLRGLRTLHTDASPPPSVQAPEGVSQSPDAKPSAPGEGRAPAPGSSIQNSGRSEGGASPLALHQVIPEVPQSVRRTIQGHIKVWVRVTVNPHGSVFAAVADRTGPSRYFQRQAIEAAKKWTFPAVDAPPQRTLQIRFDFSRDGTTGQAVALH